MTDIYPDGEFVTINGKEYVSDDGELLEIADTYDSAEDATKGLIKDLFGKTY